MESKQTDSRKARIDELLLFLSSGLGILFSMLQASVVGVNSIILFAPLLLLGLAMPIYVGYIKGAVGNRDEERIRGWIYLVNGVLIYSVHIILDLLYEYYHVDRLSLPGLVVQFLGTLPAYTIVIFYLEALTGWVLGVSEKGIRTTTIIVSKITQFSAFMLSLGLEFLVRSLIAPPSSSSQSIFLPAGLSIAMIAWGMLLFWVSELWSVISRNTGMVHLQKRNMHWSSDMKRVIIRLVPGSIVSGIGAYLSQSDSDLGFFLVGIGLLSNWAFLVMFSLKTPYVVQIDSAQLERMPEERSKELLEAVHWIERIGYLGVAS